MSAKSSPAKPLFSQEEANAFLSYIAKILVYRLNKGRLLALYEDIGDMCDLELDDADDGNALLYELWCDHEDMWLTLMRQPFKELLLETLED